MNLQLLTLALALCALDCGGILDQASGSGDGSVQAPDGARVEGGGGRIDGGRDSAREASCRSGLVTLATGLRHQPLAVAVDATSVYWTNTGYPSNSGSVMKVPVCGGEATTLAADRGRPQYIAVDATSVYWVDWLSGPAASGPALVMKVPIGGGALVTLASVPEPSTPCGIAVDGTSVYWATMYSGGDLDPPPVALVKVPLGGGAPTTLASEAFSGANYTPFQCGVAVDATRVYWTTNQSILTVPRDGGAVTTLVSLDGFMAPNAIAIDATSLYWTSNAAALPAPNLVMKVSLNGGTPTTLGSTQGSWGIAVDSTSVYWTEATAVMRVPLDGGPASVLAATYNGANGLAVDGTSVYWVDGFGGSARTTTNDGAVLKLTPK
jgi:hypothetical protein